MTTPPFGSPSENNPYENNPYEPYGQSGGQASGQAGAQDGGAPYGAPYTPPAQPCGQPTGPYGAAPYGGYGYPVPARTNGLAIGSLVTSLVSLTLCMGMTGVVGAILGHVARGQIKRNNEQGGGLALAGIIIGWLGFAFFVGFVVLMIVLVAVADNSVTDCSTYDCTYG